MTVQKNKKRAVRIKDSFIVTYVMRFASFIYSRILKSIFAFLMTSYDAAEEAARNSFAASVYRKAVKKFSMRGAKQRAAREIERSVLLGFSSRLRDMFLSAPISVFGVFSASFGLYSSVIYIMKAVAFDYERNFTDPAAGAVFLLLSVCFFSSKLSVSQAFAGSRFFSFLINDFLGIRRTEAHEESEEGRRATNIMFMLGMILGLCTIFVRPLYIVAAAALIAFAMFVMTYPEAGVLLVFLLLPFMKTMALAATVILIAISFFVKLIRGKRVIKLALADIPVVMLAVFFFLGGVNSVDRSSSIKKMLLYICLISMYFIVRNLICSQKMLVRAISCYIVSLGLVSLIGIGEYFIGTPTLGWIDTGTFDYIRGRAVSTFENPNVLGEFLIMTVPTALAFALAKQSDEASPRRRFASAISALLGCACLILTWSRGAWLGFAVSLLVFALIASRKFFAALIIASPLASLLIFAKDTAIFDRFTNFTDSSTSYRLNIWRGSLAMIRDNLISGIGIGEQAFSSVYPAYSIGGAEVAYHSHSLYLQLTAEMGIFALVFFLIFMLFLASRCFSYLRSCTAVKEKMMCMALFSGIFAFLFQGLTDFVFYNYRIFLFFWMMVGLAVSYTDFAAIKKKEDAEHYFSEL